MRFVIFFLKFLIKHFVIIHKGSLIAKGKSTLLLAICASPITYVIEKITNWGIENQEYILFVLGAIMVDHFLGSIVHAFIKRDFTWKKNVVGLAVKIGMAVAMGFLFEGVNYIIEEESFVKSYLIIVLRLAVFLYPAGSAAMNCALITKGKFPPIGFLDKIKKFNTNLDLTALKKEIDE